MTDDALTTLAYGLKELDRAGWLRVGVERPESVAAHAWGTAFLALLRCPPELDRGRLVSMCVLHDLAEAVVGDITPHDGIPRDEKHRREAAAIASMLADHPELRALWDEAERGETAEARFLKELDREDMRAQARIYGARGHVVAEFFR